MNWSPDERRCNDRTRLAIRPFLVWHALRQPARRLPTDDCQRSCKSCMPPALGQRMTPACTSQPTPSRWRSVVGGRERLYVIALPQPAGTPIGQHGGSTTTRLVLEEDHHAAKIAPIP